jgi:light-regulated signal transduction histidine kinase (bacteriophytochrome)
MLVSAVIRDITERKRTERRLAEQAVALARSNAELEQFAYVASHDLQEPLRKIASFCSLLKADYGGELDEMADTYIDYAVDGAIRMQALIRDLLEYSRVARREVRLEPVDVRAAVDTALRNLDAMREEADVALLIDAMPTIPAERSQLVQLYQNLIANAIKFRAPGRRCEIEVGSRPDAGGWLFWVRDNGIGIDQSHTDQVFEMFRRLHARTEFAGTGIGLAICRRIVERMGGRIWVESAPGAGATFWWTVPMKQAA